MDAAADQNAKATTGGRFAVAKLLLIFLLPAVIAFTAFYIFYSQRNAAYLTERNYRVLATIGTQILSRLDGAQAAVKGADASKEGAGRCTHQPGKQWAGPYLTLLDATPKMPVAEQGTLKLASGNATLYLKSGGTTATLNLGSLLAALMTSESFDDIILFELPSGAVIHQRREAHTGSVPDLKTLIDQARNAEAAEDGATQRPTPSGQAVTYSAPQITTYFGQQYRLFFQPVRFPASPPASASASASAPAPAPSEWLLCGLVSTDRFTGESRRISPLWLAALAILVVVAALAWPTLNLLYIGPRERLSGRDVRVMVGTWVTGTALVTFCVMNLFNHGALSTHYDALLRSLALEIDARFRKEMGEAFAQLRRLQEPGDDRARLQEEPPSYWYFNNLLLVGGDGQAKKTWVATACNEAADGSGWKIEPGPTPDFSVRDRSYFVTAQSGRLPYFADGQSFAMERVQAKTTGENVVALAIPLSDQPSPEVAVIGSRLVSLFRPILPSSFGFAVLDGSGEVVIHSNFRRNGVENFFLECDGNRALSLAVRARSDTYLDAQYQGRAHRLFVHPLKGTDWTLVVFRDKGLLATINAETTAAWALFCGVYLAGFLLAAVGIQLVAPAYRADWLWPDPRRATAYLAGAGILLLLAGLLAGAAWRDQALANAWLVLVVPPLAVSLLYLLLTRVTGAGIWPRALAVAVVVTAAAGILRLAGDYGGLVVGATAVAAGVAFGAERYGRSRWQPGPGALRFSYVLLLAGLLAVLAAAPSLVIFMDAQRQGAIALTKHVQRQFVRAMLERDTRLRREFRETGFSEQALQARLKDQRDVYWADVFTLPLKFRRRALRESDTLAGRSNEATPDDDQIADLLDRHFTAAASVVIPLYNDEVGYFRQLLHDRASDGSFTWSVDSNDRLLYAQLGKRTRGGSSNAKQWDVNLRSALPPRPFPATRWWWGAFLLVAAAVAALGLAGLWSVARRLFLLDLVGSSVAGTAEQRDGSAWLYRHPAGADLAGSVRAGEVAVLDLGGLDTTEDCARWLDGADAARAVVIIDRVDSRLDDAAWDAAKLSLLESLSARAGTRVALLSAIDLSDYLQRRSTAADAAGGDMPRRWAALLGRFDKRPTVAADWTGPLVEARNRRLWAHCNAAERLALAQLAYEGFVNPKDQQLLAGLFHRDLIRRTPSFQLRDEAFRRFVLAAAPPETLRRWEREGEVSDWTRLRTPLMTLVLVGVVFFLTTQREAVNWVVGVATAATAAIPVMMRALEFLGRPREQSR